MEGGVVFLGCFGLRLRVCALWWFSCWLGTDFGGLGLLLPVSFDGAWVGVI